MWRVLHVYIVISNHVISTTRIGGSSHPPTMRTCKRNIEQSRKITEMKNNAISIHYGANSNTKQGCISKEKAEA